MAESVPGAAAIPLHPDWGRLTYFQPIAYRDFRNQHRTEARPAYVKTWGEGCAAKAVQTTVVTDAMWNSLGYITNQPWLEVIRNAMGQTVEDRAQCGPIVRATMVRLVNEATGEEAYFQERKRISDTEFTRFLSVDEPAVPHELSRELLNALNEPALWSYAYSGMFSIRPQPWARNFSSRFAYVSLMEAYSRRIDDGDGSCRFAGDASGTITISTEGAATGRRVVYLPRSHGEYLNQLVSGSSFFTTPHYRQHLDDARRIVARLPCADPRLAILRENLFRWHIGQPALTDTEREQFVATIAPAAPRAPAVYPVFEADWRPFVDSCMANWRTRTPQPTFGHLVSCTCAEYITQVAGDRALYDIFTRNWIAGEQTSTPKSSRWIEMWNTMCGNSAEQNAPEIAVEHANQY